MTVPGRSSDHACDHRIFYARTPRKMNKQRRAFSRTLSISWRLTSGPPNDEAKHWGWWWAADRHWRKSRKSRTYLKVRKDRHITYPALCTCSAILATLYSYPIIENLDVFIAEIMSTQMREKYSKIRVSYLSHVFLQNHDNIQWSLELMIISLDDNIMIYIGIYDYK